MPIGRRLASVFARLLSKQQQHVQAGDDAGSAKNHGNGARQEQPITIGGPPSDNASQAEEREHRRAEQRYWKWSIALTLLTIALTSVGIYVASSALKASWRAVDEARRQAEIARLSLIASDRAWLQVTTFQPEKFTINASEVSISSSIKIRNVGHSPALNVQVMVDLLASSRGGDLTEVNLCDTFKKAPLNVFSNVIFPGEETAFDDAKYKSIAIPDVLVAQGKDINSAPEFFAFFLLAGCVIYQSPTTGPLQHGTSFGLIVSRKCPSSPVGCAFEVLQEAELPPDELEWRAPFKSNAAD